MSNYDYKNIFDLLGIKEYNNPEYLKENIKDTVKKTKTRIANIARKRAFVISRDSQKILHDIEILKEKNKSLEAELSKNIPNEEKNEIKREIEINKTKIEQMQLEVNVLYDKMKKIKEELDSKEKEIDHFSEDLLARDDVSVLLLNLIRFKDLFYLHKKKDELMFHDDLTDSAVRAMVFEENPVLKDALKMFKKPEDVEKYVSENLELRKYVNFEGIDFSRRLYNPDNPENRKKDKEKRPEFLYTSLRRNEPVMIASKTREDGTKVRVYDVGLFKYGQFVRDEIYIQNSPERKHIDKKSGILDIIFKKPKKVKKNSHYVSNKKIHLFNGMYRSDELTMLTVVVEDDKGNTKLHNLVMNISEDQIKQDEDFYMNVVFSDLVIKNAEENNAGFVGTVEKSDGVKMLTRGLKDGDTVAALSYALTDTLTRDRLESEDEWYFKPWNCICPQRVFKETNDYIEIYEIIRKAEQSKNTGFPDAPGDNEGGR